jgi:hypothetical protein
MSDTAPDPRVARRAAELLPEEDAVGSDDPHRQAEVILEDSDARAAGRDPDVEHRTSDEATPPVD